jgi:hypothetical protein
MDADNLPDFDWDREERWMKTEALLRDQLSETPAEFLDDLISGIRTAFDLTWVDMRTPDIVGPIHYLPNMSHGEFTAQVEKSCQEATRQLVDFFRGKILKAHDAMFGELTMCKLRILLLEKQLRNAGIEPQGK